MLNHHALGFVSNIAPYSDAVSVQGEVRWLFTSGMPGIDEQGNLPADFASQAQRAWSNILEALSATNMSVENIVRVNHFLTRRQDLPEYRNICTEVFGKHCPASTLMFVAGLPLPNMLIELQIDAVASLKG